MSTCSSTKILDSLPVAVGPKHFEPRFWDGLAHRTVLQQEWCGQIGELGYHDVIEIGTSRCMATAGRSHGAAWLIHTEVHIQAFDPVFVGRVLGLALDAVDLKKSVHCHDASVVD